MEKEIGVLWVKNSPKGQYMTGSIEVNGEKIALVCFLNSNKKEAKHPDWRIMKAKPRENDQPLNALPTKKADTTASQYPEEEINPEDIPF